MYCMHCGANLPDGARFCAQCGQVVGTAPSSTAQQPNPETVQPFSAQPTTVAPEDVVPVSELFFDGSSPVRAQAAPTADAAASPAADDAENTLAQASSDAIYTPVQNMPEPTEKKKKKKNHLGLILGISIPFALLMIAAVVLFIWIVTMPSGPDLALSAAYVNSSNGKAFVCYEDGQFVDLGDDIQSAVMTPNRDYVVMFEEDGTLRAIDAGKTEDIELIRVNTNTVQLEYLCTDVGVFYCTSDSSTGRISYYCYPWHSVTGKAELIVSAYYYEYDDVVESRSPYATDYAMAYAMNGEIFTYDGYENTLVATYDAQDKIDLIGVCDYGYTVLWATENQEGVTKLMLSRYFVISEIVSGQNISSYHLTMAPNGADLWILTCGNTMYYQIGEEGVKSLSFSDDIPIADNGFTTNGMPILLDRNVFEADGLYLTAGGDLYLVNIDTATFHKLVDDVSEWSVNGESLYYLDKDNTLFLAKIRVKEGKLTDIVEVDQKVSNIQYAIGHHEYLYYMKDMDRSNGLAVGELCAYDIKAESSHSVATLVYRQFHVSIDGSTVYYFDDVRKAESDSVSVMVGTLHSYHAKSEKALELAKHVVVGSLTSHLVTGDICADDMWFQVYQQMRENTYVYNVYHYNGEETAVRIKGMSA